MFQFFVTSVLCCSICDVLGQVTLQPHSFYQGDLSTFSIALDPSSSYIYSVGLSYLTKPSPGGLFVSKSALNGTLIWMDRFNFTRVDNDVMMTLMVKVDPISGDPFIAGKSFGSYTNLVAYSGGSVDGIYMRYCPNGTRAWSASLGSTLDDYLEDVVVQPSMQRIVIVGFDGNGGDVVALALMSNGSITRRFGESNAGLPTGDTRRVYEGENVETVYIGSWFWANFGEVVVSSGPDACVSKFLLNGTRLWSRTILSTWDDFVNGLWFEPSLNMLFAAGSSDRSEILVIHPNGTMVNRLSYGVGGRAYALIYHVPSQLLYVVGSTSAGTGYLVSCSYDSKNVSFALSTTYYGRGMALSSDFRYMYVTDASSSLYVAIFPNVSVAGTPLLGTPKATPLPSSTPVGSSVLITSTAPFVLPMTLKLPISTPSITKTYGQSALTSALQASAEPQNPTAGENVPFKGTFLAQSLNLFIIAAAFTIFHVLLVFGCCFVARSRARRLKKKEFSRGTMTASDTFSSFSLANSETRYSSYTTLIRSNFELSLPGYLMVECGPSFRVSKHLAKGGGGVVSIADAWTRSLTTYGTTIAVKTIGSERGTPLYLLAEREQKSFKQEVSIMHYFREEKHIAKFLGWSNAPACILMKYYPRGSLNKWIHSFEPKSKSNVVQFMQDIARGVLAMHKSGFVHCDLKPHNVLLDVDDSGQLYCCITDFGITQIVDDSSLLVQDFAISNVKGLSTNYAAPEAFRRFRSKDSCELVTSELATKVDLYSLAVIVFELLHRRSPWVALNK